MAGGSSHIALIGATIGNYRVVAKLGEGGMGSVYLAEHPLIGKKVALKVLHEEHTSNEDVVSRFFTEAKAVNDIGHPNIVDIIDFGRVQTSVGHGFVYFIMEYLHGEAIASLIQREAPLPPERAIAIGLQVADALSASHAKGIVHRDLKPDNIFLVERGRSKDNVKVLDFGIAKLVGDQGGSKRTRTGIVMGTPAYMSPEQCEGKGLIDHRTDVYALGIVLYEMLAGRVPFVGEGYGEILVQHLTQPPPPLSQVRAGIDPSLEAVIHRALEKKRDNRYQTMDEMIEALKNPQAYVAAHPGMRAAAQQATVAGKAPHVSSSASPQVQFQTGPGVAPPLDDDVPARSRMPLYIGVGVGVAGLVAVTLVLLGGGDDKKPDEPATPPVVAGTPPAKTEPPQLPDKKPPPPEPDPPPPPPVAANVTVTIESDPRGAEVHLNGVSMGATPLPLKLKKDSGEQEVLLKAPNFKDETRMVSTAKDGKLFVDMHRIRTASTTRRPPPPVASGLKPNPTGTKPPATGTKPGGEKPTGTKPGGEKPFGAVGD